MQNITKVIKYLLQTSKVMTFICFSIILFNILLSVIGNYFITNQNIEINVSIGSIDMVAIIIIFILGLNYFKPSFKFILANGVSRKRFFWATIPFMAILSAFWAVAVIFFTSISSPFTKINVLYEQLFENMNVFGATVWVFALLFLVAILGWFINMLYYRSNKRMKLVVTFAPFILSGLLTFIHYATGGTLLGSLLKCFVAAMGFSSDIPNPYIGALSMLLFAAILCSFNFLLIRKAQMKD